MGSTPLSVWCRRPADGPRRPCLARRRNSNKCPNVVKTLKPGGVVQMFMPANECFRSAGIAQARYCAETAARSPRTSGTRGLATQGTRSKRPSWFTPCRLVDGIGRSRRSAPGPDQWPGGATAKVELAPGRTHCESPPVQVACRDQQIWRGEHGSATRANAGVPQSALRHLFSPANQR